MARFRATIQGQRGEASRLGSSKSGMFVNAQSYQGDIVVQFFADARDPNVDQVHIRARDHGSGASVVLYSGAVAALLPAPDREARPVLIVTRTPARKEPAHV